MGFELAWGRLRRGYLRHLRPGYVQRVLARRQGECPGCPHDIIDPRDLKFVRNVCGYWFRPEDDRYRWRGRLGLARYGLAEVLCVSLVLFPVAVFAGAAAVSWHPAFGGVLLLVLAVWFELVFFFRDPERAIPADPQALVSPADGTVTHIDVVDEPGFPGGQALRISIFLSVFNVHVNRSPRAARVGQVRYFPGAFLDARHPECGTRNEQLWLDLEEPGGRPLRVKQISGKIARRIVCWLKAGDDLAIGERFGMIKFGSRTEVYLPAADAVELRVKVGDRVRGGSTILLRFAGS